MKRLALALLLVAAAGCNSSGSKPLATAKTLSPQSSTYQGVLPTGTAPRPHFLLTDTFGKAYDFTKETEGKPTLIYFGYTRCPDECPTTMHDIHAALREVSDEVRKKVIVIFVTTDPSRDTPTVLSHWLQSFDSTFIGLTGSPSQIAAAETAVLPAGLPPAVADTSAPLPNHQGYSVNHAAVVVAYDTANRNPVLYPSGTSVDAYASDFALLAKESS